MKKRISRNKVYTFPWLRTPYMVRGRLGLDKWDWLNSEWNWYAHETLDAHVASRMQEGTSVVALSGSGLKAGTKAQQMGGTYICDRGSSHIRYQDRILKEAYKRWGKILRASIPG